MPPAKGVFSTKSDLITALELVVCDVDSDAIKLYGAPNMWDVSAVTDMSSLMPFVGCETTFNAVRTYCHITHGLSSTREYDLLRTSGDWLLGRQLGH